jgi:hypothetical protein
VDSSSSTIEIKAALRFSNPLNMRAGFIAPLIRW